MLFAIRTSTKSLINEIKTRDAGVVESIRLIFLLILEIMSLFLLKIRGFVQGGGFMDTVKSMGCTNINWIAFSLIVAPVIFISAKVVNR